MSFFKQVWFLDCFGHIITYMPAQKRVIRTPLQGTLMDGFVASPYPVKGPATLTWWTLYGKQIPVESFSMEPTKDGFVALRRQGTKEYLSINPRTDHTCVSHNIDSWEKFIPLPKDALRGILLCNDPDMTTISSNQSLSEDHLSFPAPDPSKPNAAYIGTEMINMQKNIDEFQKISQLTPGKKINIAFNLYYSGKTKFYTIFCNSLLP